MRKLIAGMNMTLDGFCDHTTMNADEEIHEHYTEVLRNSGDLIYGRITYQLMESYWPAVLKNPTGDKSMDEFALAIQDIPKTVFSHTLTNASAFEWNNVTLATRGVREEVLELKQRPGKDILVGSPSLIVAAMNLDLVDEFQICVHPIIASTGLSLLKNINDRIDLKLLKTKTFGCGAVMLYYEPVKK